MKPHRIRVTHDLVAAYDMLDKMDVLVSAALDFLPCRCSTYLQRPKRASAETMTSFHTDEYINFLTRVTPETAEELTYHGTRCKSRHGLLLRTLTWASVLVGEDNPPFEGVFEFCSLSAGGSICGCGDWVSSTIADIHQVPRSD
jgi:histone deacetylase 1/2